MAATAVEPAPLEHDRPLRITNTASEVAGVAAPATVAEAADLLCRFGAQIDERHPRPGATPGERAAWRLALDVHASTSESRDGLATWIREAVELAGSDRELPEPDRAAVALLLWFHLTKGRMLIEGDVPTGPALLDGVPHELRPLLASLGNPHELLRSRTLGDRLTRCSTLTLWKRGDGVIPDASARECPRVPLPNRLDALVPVTGRDNRDRFESLAAADRRGHLGYAVPRGSSPRHRRAVEAAHLLRNLGAPFVDVMTLFACHGNVFGAPDCTPSTYARTLAGFPHLLIEGVSHRWAVLDDEPATSVPRPSSRTPERRASPPVEADETGDPQARTIAARIHDRLADEPVLHMGELAARLGDVSRGSAAGTVDHDPSLRHYAPGLIARYADLDVLVTDPPQALMQQAQWRLLSDALRSGERPDESDPLFPAWHGDALQQLVRWGRGAGLRFVDARTRLRDEDLLAMHSGFKARHLVAMLVACAERPSIGWMRLNRLLGARVDSRGAIWPVALLASLGVVELGAHWQHPLATDRARANELRAALFALARTRDRLRWRDPALRELLGRFDARDRIDSPAVSAWLRGRRAAHFLDGRLGG